MLPQAFLRASLKGLSAASYANCLLVFLSLFSLSSGSFVHGLGKVLGSWHFLSKPRLSVTGEGGFGIVNETDSNIELHWTSLQKLVCLVSGRKNFTPDNRTHQKSKRGHLFCQCLSLYFCNWVIDSFPSFSERISDLFNLTSGSCDTLKPSLPPHSTPWFHSQVDVFCQDAPSLCSSWEETK